ncbi:EF-hand domain-containing protein [Mariniblastus sp.]|nr:EF-hand domain-containing protein [Mariniblastus sp.]
MKNFRCLFLIAFSLLFAPNFCQAQDSGFDLLDTDSDGELTKKELKEYTEKILPGFGYLDKFADRVDADSDGTISEAELKNSKAILQALSREVFLGGEKKEMSKEELKMAEDASKAFKSMAKLVVQGDWEKAPQAMTKQARDEYAMSVVTQSITLTKMELPPQMDVPAIKDVKDATIDVIEKYKLGDIDPSFFMKGGGGSSDNDDDEDSDMTPEEKAKAQMVERKAQQNKLKADILKAIDKDDQRWEIVAALREASKGSIFHRDIFKGKVSNSEVDDSAVFLTLSQESPGGKVVFPTVVKMTAEKGKWKYAGMDMPRTRMAMQQIMMRMRGAGGAAPAKPKSDF